MNFLVASTDVLEESQKVNLLIQYLTDQIPALIDFAKTAVFAIIIYFIGRKIIKFSIKFLERSFEKSKVEQSVESFLLAMAKIGLNIFLIVVIISILGFPASSLVAIVGSAGLTLGLALQGSLSNFAGGVLILVMKPFKIGDYIVSGGDEGTVTAIDIFYTRMLTADNRMVVIPNGTLSNSSITNVTNEPIRRLDIMFSIDYSESIERVKLLLSDIIKNNEQILQDCDNMVFVNSFDPSSIKIGIRVWVNTPEYWEVKFDLLEKTKEMFDKENITIPYEQLDININKIKE